jgi:hypothetical protein
MSHDLPADINKPGRKIHSGLSGLGPPEDDPVRPSSFLVHCILRDTMRKKMQTFATLLWRSWVRYLPAIFERLHHDSSPDATHMLSAAPGDNSPVRPRPYQYLLPFICPVNSNY